MTVGDPSWSSLFSKSSAPLFIACLVGGNSMCRALYTVSEARSLGGVQVSKFLTSSPRPTSHCLLLKHPSKIKANLTASFPELLMLFLEVFCVSIDRDSWYWREKIECVQDGGASKVCLQHFVWLTQDQRDIPYRGSSLGTTCLGRSGFTVQRHWLETYWCDYDLERLNLTTDLPSRQKSQWYLTSKFQSSSGDLCVSFLLFGTALSIKPP